MGRTIGETYCHRVWFSLILIFSLIGNDSVITILFIHIIQKYAIFRLYHLLEILSFQAVYHLTIGCPFAVGGSRVITFLLQKVFFEKLPIILPDSHTIEIGITSHHDNNLWRGEIKTDSLQYLKCLFDVHITVVKDRQQRLLFKNTQSHIDILMESAFQVLCLHGKVHKVICHIIRIRPICIHTQLSNAINDRQSLIQGSCSFIKTSFIILVIVFHQI